MSKGRALGGMNATEMLRKCRQVTLAGGKIVWNATGSRFPQGKKADPRVEAGQDTEAMGDVVPTDEPEVQVDTNRDRADADVGEPQDCDTMQCAGDDSERMGQPTLDGGLNQDAGVSSGPSDDMLWDTMDDGTNRGMDAEVMGGMREDPADSEGEVEREVVDDVESEAEVDVEVDVDLKWERIVDAGRVIVGVGAADGEKKAKERTVWTVSDSDAENEWEIPEGKQVGIAVHPKRESTIEIVATPETTCISRIVEGDPGNGIDGEDVGIEPQRTLSTPDRHRSELHVKREVAEDTAPNWITEPDIKRESDVRLQLQASLDSCKALREELGAVKEENRELRDSHNVLIEEVRLIKAEQRELLRRVGRLEVQIG
jgi:hypothetical protein